MFNLLHDRSDKKNMKRTGLIHLLVLGVIIILGGCSGETTRPLDGATYRVQALLYKELLTGGAHLEVTLSKNGSNFKEATVTLDGMEVDTNIFGYSQQFGASQILVDSSYVLNIQDSSRLNIDLTISLPGACSINSPAIRHYTGDPVSVEWTISTGSHGYILATSPPDSAITDNGYEEYVSGISGTIPPEAFVINVDERILGTHGIYVASYVGAPTAFPSLAFDIPVANNPDDNVSGTRIKGRVAGMVIAAPDSIIVAAQ